MRRLFGVLLAVPACVAGCGDDGAGDGGTGATTQNAVTSGGGAGGSAPAGGSGGTGGSGAAAGSGGAGGSGGSIEPPSPACAAAPNGGAAVQDLELIAELGDQWHEGWLASPVVADLDADGVLEIVASRHGLVLGWHLDGTIVFEQAVDGRCWASPVVADLCPNLPGLEVAQASADKIYVWQSDGSIAPGFPYTFQGELRSLAAGDVDGDGALDLVSVTTQNLQANGQQDIVVAVGADGAVLDGFPPNTSGASGCDDACYVYNGYDQNVAIGDVDGDGVSDIFATQDNAYNSLHGGTGFAFDCAPEFEGKTKFMGVRGLHDLAEAQQGYSDDEENSLQAHHTNTAPGIADIDGDGVAELVYVASVQNASQTERELGVALWVLRQDGTRPAAWTTPLHFDTYIGGLWDYGDNIVAITNQVSIADVDPERPGPEMIFAGFDGFVHAVDSARNVMFSTQYTTSDLVATGGVAVADLSGDGAPEIVFATYSTLSDVSALFVLDAAGSIVHEVPLPGRGAMAVPTIADADGDGTLDVVVSLKDSETGEAQVLVYRVPGSSDNCLLWPTGRGNYLRNGYLPAPR